MLVGIFLFVYDVNATNNGFSVTCDVINDNTCMFYFSMVDFQLKIFSSMNRDSFFHE